MKITLTQIKIRDLINGYVDSDEEGVVGFGGRLDIRPKYQREFIYNDDQKKAVIDTVLHGFPLNVMYWAQTGEDSYEVLDGQQRTLSICQYCAGDFSIKIDGNPKSFTNLGSEEQTKILDYSLMVYFCEGSDSEKLAWFKIVNIGGAVLTDQELRNAVYAGEWLTHAKRIFSKTNGAAVKKGMDYLDGACDRQKHLETALKWIADRDKTTIEGYMSKHQHDSNCDELWTYFQEVIDWAERTFPENNHGIKGMKKVNGLMKKLKKGLPWGVYYNQYKHDSYNPTELEKRFYELVMDNEVTKNKGIFAFLLSHEEIEDHLSLRQFPDSTKMAIYTKQEGKCAICGVDKNFDDMKGDHIIPWSKGGKTTEENCQMLCASCNLKKSNK